MITVTFKDEKYREINYSILMAMSVWEILKQHLRMLTVYQ